jgi:hypothetical protein
MVVHRDALGRMNDFNGKRFRRRMSVELALNGGSVAHQQDPVAKLTGCVDSAFDFRTRGLVAPHRVYGNGYHSFRLTSSLRKLFRDGFDDFAAFILSALGADAVRLLGLVAVGALGAGRPGEPVMGAARLGPLV